MNEYQRSNKARFELTGVGLRVETSMGAFWSRGWRGCPGCGGDVHGPVRLRPFIERDFESIRTGWRCA